MANKKLFTTAQLVSFFVGLCVVVSVWVSVLREWMNEGLVSLQPETFTDWLTTLGVFLVLPFTVICFITGLTIAIVIGLQDKKKLPKIFHKTD